MTELLQPKKTDGVLEVRASLAGHLEQIGGGPINMIRCAGPRRSSLTAKCLLSCSGFARSEQQAYPESDF